jgi:hypothetical protein
VLVLVWRRSETAGSITVSYKKRQNLVPLLSYLKLYVLRHVENGEVRVPLEPLPPKGEFMRRNISLCGCVQNTGKTNNQQADTCNQLAQALPVYIKRAVLSMIICKERH